MRMPEVGRQHRQQPVRLLAVSIPTQQRFDGEPMPEVMKAWTATGVRRPQSDFP
jgi:hypothetical protein